MRPPRRTTRAGLDVAANRDQRVERAGLRGYHSMSGVCKDGCWACYMTPSFSSAATTSGMTARRAGGANNSASGTMTGGE
jgi:hypothetical protein